MSAHPSARHRVGELVLVEQQGQLYDARVLAVRDVGGEGEEAERWWLVHYYRWHNRWDMWVGEKETRTDNEEARAEQRQRREQQTLRPGAKKGAGGRSGLKAAEQPRQRSTGDGQRQSSSRTDAGSGSAAPSPPSHAASAAAAAAHRAACQAKWDPPLSAPTAKPLSCLLPCLSVHLAKALAHSVSLSLSAVSPSRTGKRQSTAESALKAEWSLQLDSSSSSSSSAAAEGGGASSSSASSSSSSCIPALPNPLRRRLVLDWEWTSRKQHVLRLPRSPCVSALLSRFVSSLEATEAAGREAAMEVCCGLLSCFERCLGPLLLYRIERPQFMQQTDCRQATQHHTQAAAGRKRGRDRLQRDAAEQETVASGELAEQSLTSAAAPAAGGLSPPSSSVSSSRLFYYSGVYGAEHLLRLLVKLPGVLEQAELTEAQRLSIQRTLSLLYRWMASNDSLLFSPDAYELADRDYLQQIGAAAAVHQSC